MYSDADNLVLDLQRRRKPRHCDNPCRAALSLIESNRASVGRPYGTHRVRVGSLRESSRARGSGRSNGRPDLEDFVFLLNWTEQKDFVEMAWICG